MFVRRWWLLILLMFIGGSAAYMYTDLFVDPVYKADGSFYVNSKTDRNEVDTVTSVGQLNSNTRLAMSCAEILTRRSFLEKVAEQVNEENDTTYTWSNIKSMLSVSPVNETELLELSLTGTNMEQLPIILNTLMDLAPETIMQIINGGSLESVDRPSDKPPRVGPNITRNTIMGVIGGLVVAVLIIFLIELFDTHIKSADELKNRYREPVLGEIPSLTNEF